MKADLIKPNLTVLTDPDPKTRFLASATTLAWRRSTHGRIWKPVPEHPDAWWVIHSDDGTVAPYAFHELQPAPPGETDFDSFPLG